MKRRIFALVCALMLIALPALAVPSPSDDFYVLDQANVLSEATEWRIVYNNDLLYEACGAQIVFVTVDGTDGEAIDDYAYDLFNQWGIGSSQKSNGFLVLMAIDDDNYYAVPGTGLEDELSAGTIKLMLDDYLEPDFAVKDYDSGARTLFDALFNRISSIESAGLTAVTPPASAISSTTDVRSGGGGGYGSAPRESRSPGVFATLGRMLGKLILILVVIVLLVIFLGFGLFRRRRIRRSIFTPPPPPPPMGGGIFFGPRPGSAPRPRNRPSPPPRSGGFGGSSRPGSGAGRSTGSFGGGAGRSSGGFGGGRSGGGGGSRGGGAGRGR